MSTKKLHVGTLVGQWEVLSEPRSGGNAHVYKVKHASDGRLGALKQLHRTTEEARARFARELVALTRLPRHPNVVHVEECPLNAEHDGSMFVMQWVDGRTLYEARTEFVGKLEESVALIAAVCGGLAHIHEQGIVHRDVKPDNMLLSSGTPVLADLGLCWFEDETGERITPSDRPTGAWGFRAPECEHCRVDEVGKSADVFSLVKVLWWLIHGGPPFASAHFEQPEFDLARKFGDVRMQSVMVLMHKAITPDPKSRKLKDAGALKNELEQVRQQLAMPAKGRIAARVSKAIQAQRASEEALHRHAEMEAEIAGGYPAMRQKWMRALNEAIDEANTAASAAGSSSKVTPITSRHGDGREPDRLGFAAGGFEVVVSFSTGRDAMRGGRVFIGAEVEVALRGKKGLLTSVVGAFPTSRLRPMRVGNETAMALEKDETRTPVEPTELWGALLSGVLSHPACRWR